VTVGDPYVPQQTYPKKRRIWPWILGAVVVMALCGFGGIAFLAAGTNKVVQDVHASEAARTADVQITACNLGAGGLATVKYKIHNGSQDTQDYTPTFNIEDAAGNVYGQTADIVTGLAPGKDYKGQAVGTFGEASVGNIRCVVTGA
jgi:hypothetical protein